MDNYLKKVRTALGWTQEQMAAELEKSTSMVRFYERGAFVAPDDVAAKVREIARAQGLEHLIPRARGEPVPRPEGDRTPGDYGSLDNLFPGITASGLNSLQEAWQFFRDAPDEVARPIIAAMEAWLSMYATHDRKRSRAPEGSPSASRKERKTIEDLLYFVRRADPDEVREMVHRAAAFRRYDEKEQTRRSTQTKHSDQSRR